MKLLIIGASRGIGLQFLEQALQAGHTITAFVRNPQRLAKQHERLRVIVGDILDPETVQEAMVGQEAACITSASG
jgi:putative NADH-flavin reductase